MVKKVGTALSDILFGSRGADQLYGLAERDFIQGRAGNDVLDGGGGDDDLRGGAGNDTYIVDHRNDISRSIMDPGIDLIKASVNYTLGPQQENLSLTGKAPLKATGNKGDNILIGNAGNNILSGGDGNDHLDGVRGRDSLRGGKGNDSYTIHRVSDIDITRADPGFDQVQSKVSYTLGAQQEDLYLLGSRALSASGNQGNNRVIGNSGANLLSGAAGDDLVQGAEGNDTLRGDAGNDVLLGGAGDDILFGGADNDYLDGGDGNDQYQGGAGNDQYLLGSSAELDKLIDDPGIDKVGASFDYRLGLHQEALFLLGSIGLTGTGNEGDNQLFGTAGTDILSGMAGDDYLDGGDGHDSLRGGSGNDVYILREVDEIALDLEDSGIDEVRTSMSYTLGPQQENLVLATSAAPIDADGNNNDNILVGNDGGNTLHGHEGDDELRGGGGADRLFGDAGADILHFAAGALLIDGGAGADALHLGRDELNLDLTTLADDIIQGIETIALVGSANHSLTLNLADVLALSDSSDTLNVIGHAGDLVSAIGQGWQSDTGGPVLNGGRLYNAYSLGSAHLLIETEITQTIS